MLTIRDMWQMMKGVLRAARQIVNAELEPLGLTSAEGDVLFYLLADSDGLAQEQLAERLDIGKAAVSRTVDSLVLKEYVRREKKPNDARVHCVTLTQKAFGEGEKIKQAYNGVYDVVKRGIADTEFQNLAVMLLRISENLQVAGGRE